MLGTKERARVLVKASKERIARCASRMDYQWLAVMRPRRQKIVAEKRPTSIMLQRVFEKIIADPRYGEGLTYGKPRRGHQEGTVANHLAELDRNLDKLRPLVNEDEYWKLKILIHVHDTFKKWATRDAPIDNFNSHATLARNFLAEFTNDSDLLNMVQYHDENFALWKQCQRKGEYSKARFLDRIIGLILDMDLFLTFTILDGYTASKMALAEQEKVEKLRWFVDQVNIYRETPRAYRALEAFGI